MSHGSERLGANPRAAHAPQRRVATTLLTGAVLIVCTALTSCTSTPAIAPDARNFDRPARAALQVMQDRARELNIGGVAVVAYFAGEHIESWVSRMAVVGRYTDPPTAGEPGNNLLAIVYSKAAEMADTHRDSGSQSRAALTGEVGWPGGVIARGRHGYLIAAFSGGEDPQDLQIARAGLARLAESL